MEVSNNPEQIKAEAPEAQEERRLSEATQRVGEALGAAFKRIRSKLPPGELLRFDAAKTFSFSVGSKRVFVEVTDYRPGVREEGSLIRSYRVRLTPPDGNSRAGWEWLVNEFAQKRGGVKFEPVILEHQDTRRFLEEQYGQDRPDLALVDDPTVAEVELAAMLIEESSRRYATGEHTAIAYGT